MELGSAIEEEEVEVVVAVLTYLLSGHSTNSHLSK